MNDRQFLRPVTEHRHHASPGQLEDLEGPAIPLPVDHGRADDRPRKRHGPHEDFGDRKSTRLNSSHSSISYAVFCLKKKKKIPISLFKKYKNRTKLIRMTQIANFHSYILSILYYNHLFLCFFFNDTATTEIYTLSLHDALPIGRTLLERIALERDRTVPVHVPEPLVVRVQHQEPLARERFRELALRARHLVD